VRSIHDWLDEYNESHKNKLNKLAHWICVPAIMLSLLGLLWSIRLPQIVSDFLPSNWAILIMLLALLYYFLLSVKLALGMAFVAAIMSVVILWMDTSSTPLWIPCLIIFIAAWIGQFIGHMIEGKRPSFFKDLQFLLIGPMWLLALIYGKAGIKY
jgi:uncharacterized membrane protein YGL010W